MRKTLLLLAFLANLGAACIARTPFPPDTLPGKPYAFPIDDQFRETDLHGYLYAFSTVDSNLRIQDILSKKLPFTVLERLIPHFGNDHRYHWIRATIINNGTQVNQLVSYLHQNELSDIAFYIVNDENEVTYQQEHFSQRTYINQKPIITRYFAFPVDIRPQQEVTIYWRVFRDENSVILPFKLYQRNAFHAFLVTYDSLAFISLGVILSAFLLSFILFFVTKYKLLIYYAGYCLFYFILCIANDGIILQYFHIDPFEIAIGVRLVTTGLMMYFLLQFSRYFLSADHLLWRWVVKTAKYLAYILPVLSIAIAVLSLNTLFVSIFFLMGMFSIILIFVMIIVGMIHRKRAAYFYFIAAGPYFASCIWFALIILFGVPTTWFYYTSILYIPIIEMVVLGIELGNRLIRERDKYYRGLNDLQRELTSSILKTQDAERRRIAADLHDELGGTLATIRLKFASLKRGLYLRENIAQPEMQDVEEIEPLIHKSSNDLRRISQTLMPPEFERIGLAGSIKHVVDSLSAHNAKFTFLTAGEKRNLYTEKELAIYRITTEMVQYICRRDQVSRGSAQLLYCDEHLRVVIEADEKIGSVTKTDEIVRKDLSSYSLLVNYLDGNFYLEVSHSGIFIIAEIPY
ncbi:hypothetical protein DYBT9623_04495 [Dyadobacter sp. CECT 9623]|uniref:histidine kinase n=1 Tax=Dyadobacter linearis TaxID=2823330 RepID=A0ABM8UVX3_9BACT|nr:7TM diverse intracellular signaling domain-containing protein [Dyadobacter sp. CECT 9623]CAG5072961.1 hypothetical protein DYBT9623_04495 [Dyadobacter sp. CECT 9623]